MLLAIDAGNTNIVFAVCEGETIRAQWRAATKTSRTADEYAVWLSGLMELQGLSFRDLDRVIIATVVPAALFDLRTMCRRYLHCEPIVIGSPEVALGIEVHVDRPDTVGADRLVNAVSAHERYPGALIVIDFGTATTFDVIAATGGYEGGVIAPGVNLSAEALHQAAAMLPRVAFHRTQQVIAKDTVPAMQSGMYWGYVGLIEGLIARIKAEYGQPMTVIATGGLAPLVLDEISVIDAHEPWLTLIGLRLVYERNITRGE